ncbi:hypothetical protein GCM10010156_19470 [Planobispora rosea]|uniref:Secreted protein n=1 Tax=Planobispora rosea TaxID=35762 RepID=A0A8J3RZ94_PLARO|nr:hypothetical protein [Planobispora rosea]GGS60849.1 hypothetical protein GCM10010156_19470 [Planobispora rosea]GIH83954.1 hypothetical protein Pro02_23620 [Planobispora rosea]
MPNTRLHSKRITAAGGAALLLVLLGSTAAQAAPPPADESASGNVVQLGEPTPLGTCTGPLCGRVKNHSNSDTDLWIINNWPPETANGAFVKPGETSTKYFKDTDGFYIPTGCKGVRSWAPDLKGGYWYKINDLHSGTVKVDC